MCGNGHHQKKVAASIISQLKFIYTSAHSVPTNRRSRELENQDIAAILETWRVDSHTWSAAVDGCNSPEGKSARKER